MYNMKTKHNYLVDIIKLLAAVMVILSHSFHLSSNTLDPVESLTNGFLTFGGLAVAIFFTYSGYYVSKSLKKNDKKYIGKRAKRIFPELIIVVLITIFIIGPIFTTKTMSEYFLNFRTYFYLLNAILIPYHNLPGVFLNNCYGPTVNGALWTLPVEFFCYILLFVLYKIFKYINKGKDKEKEEKEKGDYLIIISNVLLIIGLVLLKTCFSNLSISQLAISAIRPIIVFLNAAYLSKYEKINKNLYIISLILLPTVFFIKNFYYINIVYCFLIPIALIGSLRFNIKENKIVSFLGESTYAMYLFGFVIQQSVVAIFGGQMLWYVNFIISAIVSIVLGCILNYLMIKLKSKYNFLK